MRRPISLLLSFLSIFIFISLSIGFTYAADLSIWDGKWFKLTETFSGLESDETGPISRLKENREIYIHIYEVDNTGATMQYHRYDYRDGFLDFWGSGIMEVLGGTDLDFFWWIQSGPHKDVVAGGMAGRIEGKMKNGVLKSAKIKSLGGGASLLTDLGPAAGAMSWSGSWVSDEKVPPEKVVATIQVIVPATTDASGHSVYITGTLSRLGSGLPDWDPAGVALTRVDATRWTVTLTGVAPAQIEYKYTLGEWNHVEKDADCAEISNRILTLPSGSAGSLTVNDTVRNWSNISPCAY
jgi:hypothetical protein